MFRVLALRVSTKSRTRPYRSLSVRSGLECLWVISWRDFLYSDAVLAVRVSSVAPVHVPLRYPLVYIS